MLGIFLLALAALAGMAGLLSAFPWLRLAIHVFGAAYLVWFGVRLLQFSRAGNGQRGADRGSAEEPPIGFTHAWTLGLLTQLSNAQAIVFITSIFAVAGVLDAGATTGLVCIATIVAMNASYLGALGWLFRLPRVRAGYARGRAALLGVMGVLFASFGLRLLWRELASSSR
jgi:threonine/homoserine/homoserine lactone efflux protein